MESILNAPLYTQTVLHPLGLAIILAGAALTLLVPRQYAILAILIPSIFVTEAQRILICGVGFDTMRILILFGVVRVVVRGEVSELSLCAIDKIFILWIVMRIVCHTLLWGTGSALVYQLGAAYTAMGLFFLFRCFLRSYSDIEDAIKFLVVICIPLAMIMVFEQRSGRNLFAVFGGVPEETLIREGRLRCQGPFAHPILAGTFGATLLPLFISLWWREGRAKVLACAGVLAALLIVMTSSSSGPICAAVGGVGALCLWPVRTRMRFLRWGLVSMLLFLHAVMNAPVWFLIARMDVVSGSGGYHRGILMDRAIANLDQWWLWGAKDTSTWGLGLFDITNEFIFQGTEGGLFTMIFFIIVIALCYRAVGTQLQIMKNDPFPSQFLVWSMGSALFAHTAAFFSVSYFDQTVSILFLLMAMITNGYQISLQRAAVSMNYHEFLRGLIFPRSV
jgi:hypothetical protein